MSNQSLLRQLRSPTANVEVKYQRIYKDTRSFGDKFKAFFRSTQNLALVITAAILLMYMKPGLSWIFLPLCPALVAFVAQTSVNFLPFNLPAGSAAGKLDPHDIKPARSGLSPARGKVLLGNCMRTLQELWLTFPAVLRHMVYFGTTGAGKTEALGSLVASFLCQSSGVIFSDAKATPKLGWQIMTLAVYFGRIEDFRAFNFLTGSMDANRDPATRLSNTMAPFAAGGSDTLSQLILNMLADEGPNNANAYFKGRAVALINTMMPALVDLRDQGLEHLSPSTISNYSGFNSFFSLAENPYISSKSRDSLLRYLRSLSGYKEGEPAAKQVDEARRSYGQAQSYFTEVFGSMSDSFGHIFESGMGEIDYRDVIFNDRIMVTMLPTMEKSPVAVQNLARMNLAGQRIAMSVGLGTEFEGSREDVIEALPSSSKIPTLVVNDEFGFMAVKDYSVTAAQCRGLNIAIATGAQDYAGLLRALDKESEQFIANAQVKFIMTTVDAGATIELVKKLVGEMLVYRSSGKERNKKLSLSDYKDSSNLQLERVSRIDPSDLKMLVEGEGFALYQDQVLLTTHFHHGLDEHELIKDLTVLRMAETKLPTRGHAAKLVNPAYRYLSNETRIWLQHARDGDTRVPDKLRHPPKQLAALAENWSKTAQVDASITGPAVLGGFAALRSGKIPSRRATGPTPPALQQKGQRLPPHSGVPTTASSPDKPMGPLGCASGDFGPAQPTPSVQPSPSTTASPTVGEAVSVVSANQALKPAEPKAGSPRKEAFTTAANNALAKALGGMPAARGPVLRKGGKDDSLADSGGLEESEATAEELEAPADRQAASEAEPIGQSAFTAAANHYHAEGPPPFSDETARSVAEGVAAIESAMGSDPDSAAKAAEQTLQVIRSTLQFPRAKPGKQRVDKKAVESILMSWIKDNIENQDK